MIAARDPDGSVWEIKRHWLSLRPRWRGGEWWDVPDVGNPFELLDDNPFAFVFGLVLLALLALFLFPVFAIVIEVAIAVVALTVTIGAKVLFRRPWIVEARTSAPPEHVLRWKVVGWRRSHEIMLEIRDAIEAGREYLSPHAEPIAGETHSVSDAKKSA